jgi:hypothetical protein
MDYDTWKTTDVESEFECELEEAEEKDRRDAAADLFDQFALGDEVAIDEVMDMLDDTGRWQDVIEALRAAYYRPGESHADKALRVLLAYEAAMDDVCLRIAEGESN